MPIILDPIPPAPPASPPAAVPEALPSAADDYYARLGPLTEPDPDNGYVLQAFADALTSPLQTFYEVMEPTATLRAWETALDPATCPVAWLPWLAQIPGVQLAPADSEQDQRDRISQAAGLYTGTERAIRESVARTLVSRDPDRVRVVYPSRWTITVLSHTADTPSTAASTAAALEQIPAGTLLTFVASDEPFIDEGTRTINAGTVTIDSPPTLADVT